MRVKVLVRSIAEIAIGCGFYDQSHLTHALHLETGSTPGAIRRAARAGKGRYKMTTRLQDPSSNPGRNSLMSILRYERARERGIGRAFELSL